MTSLRRFGAIALTTALSFSLFGPSLAFAKPKDASPSPTASPVENGPTISIGKRQLPADPFVPWDGKTGVPAELLQREQAPGYTAIFQQLERAYLGVAPDVQVLIGEALKNPTQKNLQDALGKLEEEKRKALRKEAEQDAQDRQQIEKWKKEGAGPVVTRQLEQALNSKEAKDRRAFVAYGRDIAQGFDKAIAEAEKGYKDSLVTRAQALTALGGEVGKQAAAALQAGDAGLRSFFEKGYFEAEKKDIEDRNKAADEAKKAIDESVAAKAAADRARRISELLGQLIEHQQGATKTVRLAGNISSNVTNAAIAGEAQLARNKTGVHNPSAFEEFFKTVQRGGNDAKLAKDQAEQTGTQVDAVLAELGRLKYDPGVKFAKLKEATLEVATASSDSVSAAKSTLDAIVSADAAVTEAEKAAANKLRTAAWLKYTQQKQALTTKLANATEQQAALAAAAADRAEALRDEANEALTLAQNKLAIINDQWTIAKNGAARAAEQRAIAEANEAESARQLGFTEAARHKAVYLRGVASSASADSERSAARAGELEQQASNARDKAYGSMLEASSARDRAREAADHDRGTRARREATEAIKKATEGTQWAKEAVNEYNEAIEEAGKAEAGSRTAKEAADRSSGAAVEARAGATAAEGAAARARHAADLAADAAAQADHAARVAESELAQIVNLRAVADAKATEARKEQVKAATAATKARVLTQEAAVAAYEALLGAKQTEAMAKETRRNAMAAAAQARDAHRALESVKDAALAARVSAKGAKELVAPFAANDVDAKLVDIVAKDITADITTLVTTATKAVGVADTAAGKAAEDAKAAEAMVKPAYQAAQKAAEEQARAARAMEKAYQHAERAAKAAADAAAAAQKIADIEVKATNLTREAREYANQAAADARIAGMSATQAESNASAARGFADEAEKAATAAQEDVKIAVAAAAKAKLSAQKAGDYAQKAIKSAESAVKLAREAEEFSRVDQEKERKKKREADVKQQEEDEQEDIKNGKDGKPAQPELTKEEEEELLKNFDGESRRQIEEALKKAKEGPSLKDKIIEIGGEAIIDLIGLKDLRRCLGEGDVQACIWVVIDVIPISKWVKMGKVVMRIAKEIPVFLKVINRSRKAIKDVKYLMATPKYQCLRHIVQKTPGKAQLCRVAGKVIEKGKEKVQREIGNLIMDALQIPDGNRRAGSASPLAVKGAAPKATTAADKAKPAKPTWNEQYTIKANATTGRQIFDQFADMQDPEIARDGTMFAQHSGMMFIWHPKGLSGENIPTLTVTYPGGGAEKPKEFQFVG